MVINNLYISGAAALESKTNTPLIVNANAPLPLPFTLQRFKSVARWRSQVFDSFSNIQQREFPHCNGLNAGEPPNALADKHGFRIPTFEGHNHDL